MPTPDLPVLADEDSLLSQKFGREIANYFSGSPLNRVSFLRTDQAFLRSAFSHANARFLLLNNLAPLVQSDPAHLAFATHTEVAPLTGADPFGKTEEDQIRDYDSEEQHTVIVFLGIDEKKQLPLVGSEGGEEPSFTYKAFKGAPYFAVDVTPRGGRTDAANALIEAVKAKGFAFRDNSPRHMGLHAGQGNQPTNHTPVPLPNPYIHTSY
jgi:NAD+ diphosphatase